METYNRKRKENFGHSRNSFNNYKNNIIYILILDNYIPIKKKKPATPLARRWQALQKKLP